MKAPLPIAVGDDVLVRPGPSPDYGFDIPARVVAIDPGGLRVDVQYKSGEIDNVGLGNVVRAKRTCIDQHLHESVKILETNNTFGLLSEVVNHWQRAASPEEFIRALQGSDYMDRAVEAVNSVELRRRGRGR